LYSHGNGDFADNKTGWALFPISAGTQPNDDDPYVWHGAEGTASPFYRDNLCVQSNSVYTTGCSGFLRTGYGCRTIAANYYRNVSSIVAPGASGGNGFPQNDDDDFLGMPIPFGVAADSTPPTGFKGWTDFALWNCDPSGVHGKTYASGSWISWSDLLFPWDGSVPEIS
jgi:hypothetical protein